MNIREQFELRYPLPEGVEWAGVAYRGPGSDLLNVCYEAWIASREAIVVNCDSYTGRPDDYWEPDYELRLEAWRDEERARDQIAQRCRELGLTVEREEWESER